MTVLTSKRSSHEKGCKPSDPINKRRITDVPIIITDILMVGISAAIDGDAEKYKAPSRELSISSTGVRHDGRDPL